MNLVLMLPDHFLNLFCKVIFTVQHYASMVYAVVICLSVYPLGQTSILSK